MKTCALTLMTLFVSATAPLSAAHALELKSRQQLDDTQFISSWHSNAELTDKLNLDSYPSKSVRCGHLLYPSHPQQNLKEYHLNEWGEYDINKVEANSRVCLVKTLRSHDPQSCLRTDIARTIVLSDVFVDNCGEYYRGFKELSFLEKDENMGTLFSPGRTMYPNSRSEFSGEMVTGSTYAVAAKEFLKIGPPFPGDIEKSKALQREALDITHRYDVERHLYIQIEK